MSDFIKTKDEVIKNYSSNAQIGLSDKQAKENIEKFGTNSLTKKKADSLLKRIWDASTEPMLLMLIAAGLIALAVNIIRSFTGGPIWALWLVLTCRGPWPALPSPPCAFRFSV